MGRKVRKRMTKDTIPEGFSVPMALVDLIPVVFFSLSAVKAGSLFHSTLFMAGAVICLLSGVVKVNWMEQTVNGFAQLCFFIGLLLA